MATATTHTFYTQFQSIIATASMFYLPWRGIKIREFEDSMTRVY